MSVRSECEKLKKGLWLKPLQAVLRSTVVEELPARVGSLSGSGTSGSLEMEPAAARCGSLLRRLQRRTSRLSTVTWCLRDVGLTKERHRFKTNDGDCARRAVFRCLRP